MISKRYRIVKVVLSAICCLAIMLSGCSSLKKNHGNNPNSSVKIDKQEKAEEQEVKENIPPQKDFEEVRISAVGDILVHDSQLKSQYDPLTKKYDFRNNFKFVKEYIQSADIAIANLETTLGGDKRKYTGYPVFNSPDAIADALKDTGFDIITTANNHIIDGGAEGFIRTGEVLRSKGFDVIGTKKNEDDSGYVIKEIKGVKIGFTDYTFETARKGNSKTINSIPIPKQVEPLIDTFNYGTLDKDLAGMKARVEKMRADGADLIVFVMHWGEEYQRQPNSYEKKIAQSLSDYGVDIIIGGHPHVLQPIDVIKSNITNKNTLVVYSIGNFISNQCYERLNMRYPEDGVIVNIDIRKDLKKNTVTIEDVTYMPTWVHRQPKGDEKFTYEILPLSDALKDKTAYNLTTEESIWRAENSYKSTIGLIEPVASKAVGIPILQDKGLTAVSSK